MSKYINADVLREEILEHKQKTPSGFERHNEIVQILGIVDRQQKAEVISFDDIRKIIDEELKDISAMKPEDGENEITVDVMKQHYSTECRIIANRISEFIREYGFDYSNETGLKIKKIADEYGFDAQSDMAIEEMSELTKAILKFRRAAHTTLGQDFQKLADDVLEEVADVQIMLWQVVYLFTQKGYGVGEVNNLIDKKINRQLKRMEKEG